MIIRHIQNAVIGGRMEELMKNKFLSALLVFAMLLGTLAVFAGCTD
jgi:hypothetical protein